MAQREGEEGGQAEQPEPAMLARGGVAVLVASLFGLLGVAACTAPPARLADEGYLRRVAFEAPGSEAVLLRWPKHRMPLRVHLPPPPEGLFEDPRAIFDSVRGGVLDWTDAAGPGLPTFVFVDAPGDADIPIVWASEPKGDWYIAHCVYDVQLFARRFGVARILVTGRWRPDRAADLHEVYAVMLHEMGHALGLGGHSDREEDIMAARLSPAAVEGPSERDRLTLRALYTRPLGSRILGARGR